MYMHGYMCACVCIYTQSTQKAGKIQLKVTERLNPRNLPVFNYIYLIKWQLNKIL